jgi:ribosomal protein L5
MILQSITGVHAQPLFADFGDSNKGIREGMPMGAVVEIKGDFLFLMM